MSVNIAEQLKHNLDYRSSRSLSNKFRQKRVKVFEDFIYSHFQNKIDNHEQIKILDVGGRYDYWKALSFKYESICDFTLANLEKIIIPNNAQNYKYVIADGTNLIMYNDKAFDVVFSNSTIERVGKKEAWQKMADEMKRVGMHYFCQTPNKLFPIEPHFLFPFFQFLPITLRANLISKYQLGSTRRGKDFADSMAIAEGINLLSYRDLRRVFPDAKIKRERFGGLTKSFMVYD